MPAARFRTFSQKFWLGLMAATALSASMLATPAVAYTSDEEQACTGDAFRLCSSEIPNVDRVTACMVEKKSQLSPGCRVFFRSDPEPALTPVDATPSASAKPARKRGGIHAIKPKKKRKPVRSDDAS